VERPKLRRVTLDGASGFRVAGAALFGLPQTTLFARW
jgi:hypothetical protein